MIEKNSTTSTNDDARALALAGAPHGEAVLARAQSLGRGRDGRAFASPAGGMYLSVVLRPTRAPAEWSLLPLVAGLAVVDALRGSAGHVVASLKWPNDVMVGDAKLGGVLVESRFDAHPFAVVGIGLNVEAAPVPEATSLRALGVAAHVDARGLADAVLARLLARVDEWERGGARAVMRDVRAAMGTLGRRVAWGEKEGRAVDVAEDGALVVEAGDGERVEVRVGDVRIRVL